MTDAPAVRNIDPVVALHIAERQIAFDKDEKLRLCQDLSDMQEIIAAQKAKITELEEQLSDADGDEGDK